MPKYLKQYWKEITPHIWAMLKQLAIPAILAAGYGAWDWSSSGGNFELSEYLKVVMPALFFLMWFVGLYERQKKGIQTHSHLILLIRNWNRFLTP